MVKAKVKILYEDILTGRKYFRIIVGKGSTGEIAYKNAISRITKIVYMSDRFKMLEMRLDKLD